LENPKHAAALRLAAGLGDGRSLVRTPAGAVTDGCVTIQLTYRGKAAYSTLLIDGLAVMVQDAGQPASPRPLLPLLTCELPRYGTPRSWTTMVRTQLLWHALETQAVVRAWRSCASR
jgi:hypothetical protein